MVMFYNFGEDDNYAGPTLRKTPSGITTDQIVQLFDLIKLLEQRLNKAGVAPLGDPDCTHCEGRGYAYAYAHIHICLCLTKQKQEKA